MKFQDGFKKKLVQTDFQWNSDNALMTLRKKGGVTLSQSQVSLWDRVWRSFCRFCAAAVSSPAVSLCGFLVRTNLMTIYCIAHTHFKSDNARLFHLQLARDPVGHG